MPNVEDSIVSQILLAQENGAPTKVYRKAIVGKVIAKVLDPFSGGRTEVLIQGDPKVTSPAEIEISLWTPLEVKFFEQANRGLIEGGSLVIAEAKSDDSLNYTNALSDEEIDKLVEDRYFTFKSILLKITSETTVQRILEAAERHNRPANTLRLIKTHLEDLQQE